ncbi:hypothetical protein LTR56_024174 [Elasticomyces elasticus]|nr:hypothetical protein LTR56_024174 [Elasticomyces elasticus]KAK3623393.1 hypothetical protein LTR22_024411 [Elasticomyces elasticus]KAK4906047.1 hypothetical protein LTR49_024747 [Elasticomyces elasticus]
MDVLIRGLEEELQADRIERRSDLSRKHLIPFRTDVDAALTATIAELDEAATVVTAADTNRQRLLSDLNEHRNKLQQEEARVERLESWKYGGPSQLPTPSAAVEALPAMLPFISHWLQARLLRLLLN